MVSMIRAISGAISYVQLHSKSRFSYLLACPPFALLSGPCTTVRFRRAHYPIDGEGQSVSHYSFAPSFTTQRMRRRDDSQGTFY